MGQPEFRRGLLIFFLAAAVFFAAAPAFAAVGPTGDGAKAVDDFIGNFTSLISSGSGSVMSGFIAAATTLFWILAVIQFVWAGISLVFKASFSIMAFFETLVREILFIGFFYWLLTQAPNLGGWIVTGLRRLGGGGSIVSISPAGVFSKGVQIVYDLTQAAFTLGVHSAVWAAVPYALALIALTFAAAFTAVYVIEYYVAVPVGIIMLGLGGTSWSQKFAENYVRILISIGLKLCCLQIVLAAVTALLDSILTDVSNVSTIGTQGFFLSSFNLAGLSVLAFVTVRTVPEFVASFVSGVWFQRSAAGDARPLAYSPGGVSGTGVSETGMFPSDASYPQQPAYLGDTEVLRGSAVNFPFGAASEPFSAGNFQRGTLSGSSISTKAGLPENMGADSKRESAFPKGGTSGAGSEPGTVGAARSGQTGEEEQPRTAAENRGEIEKLAGAFAGEASADLTAIEAAGSGQRGEVGQLQSDPSRTDQSQTEPSRTEQSQAEQSRIEQSGTEPSRAEQSRAEQSQAEPSRIEQSGIGPSRMAQSQTEQSQTERSRIEQSRTESSRAEQSRAERSQAEPSRIEQSGMGPSRMAPSQAEQSRVEQSRTEPSRMERSQTEQSQTEQSRIEQSRTEPFRTERSQTEQSQTEHSRAEQFRTEPSRTERSQTEQSQTEQSRAEQSRTEPSRAERSQTEQSQTEQSRAEQSRTEPSRAERSQTEQSRTEPSRTEPSQTEPSRTEQSRVEQSPQPGGFRGFDALAGPAGQTSARRIVEKQAPAAESDAQAINQALMGVLTSGAPLAGQLRPGRPGQPGSPGRPGQSASLAESSGGEEMRSAIQDAFGVDSAKGGSARTMIMRGGSHVQNAILERLASGPGPGAQDQ
jgi:P-type conjugative transfer protein TrbL